jgi:hypothetical protein
MYIMLKGRNPHSEISKRILFLSLTGGEKDPTIQSSKPFDCPGEERV